MAWGVPVISTNSGGLPEVNVEGESGFMADVGAIDTMAEKAITILSTKETLATFKRNALKVAQKFDIAFVLPMYEELYANALK
jgi:glycosyltransferase involved in cell wall biosynthesis